MVTDKRKRDHEQESIFLRGPLLPFFGGIAILMLVGFFPRTINEQAWCALGIAVGILAAEAARDIRGRKVL